MFSSETFWIHKHAYMRNKNTHKRGKITGEVSPGFVVNTPNAKKFRPFREMIRGSGQGPPLLLN